MSDGITGEKEREKVRAFVCEKDDDRGRGQGKTGCRRPNPVSTGQNNSCDLVTRAHIRSQTHTHTHKPVSEAQICH